MSSAAAVLGVLSAAAMADEPAFKPLTVTLPDDGPALPDGPGADAAGGACLACHSAGMILNQPTLSRAAWQAEVKKMIGVYKAPIDPADVEPIVDYLARIKGPKT